MAPLKKVSLSCLLHIAVVFRRVVWCQWLALLRHLEYSRVARLKYDDTLEVAQAAL